MSLRILVDVDDTVAELMFGWDERQIEWPEMDTAPLYFQRTNWDIKEGLNDRQKEIVDEIWKSDTLFRDIAPTRGAQEVIATLIEQGHDVWFVSTPHPLNYMCASHKYAWLERHYDVEMAGKLILTHDKTLISGDVLIDDRPVITGVAEPEWRRIVFDRPWNQGIPGPRIKEWTMPEVNRAIWQAVVSR